jgi:hypothetical protein
VRHVLLHRHAVHHLSHAVRAQEAGDEDVGVGEIELLELGPLPRLAGDDLPAAALPAVEQGGEEAGGIEVREAAPVDGAVLADERGGMQIADYAIVLYGLVIVVPEGVAFLLLLRRVLPRVLSRKIGSARGRRKGFETRP